MFKETDTITVYALNHISKDDEKVLSLLYTPIIGNSAYGLYMFLNHVLNYQSLKSEKYTGYNLFQMTNIDPFNFDQAMSYLEAVNLISLYKKDDDYLIMIKSPQTAKQFFMDGILGSLLNSKVGNDGYEKLLKCFEIAKAPKEYYKEITRTFDKVFDEEIKEYRCNTDSYLLDNRKSKTVKFSEFNFNYNAFSKLVDLTFVSGGANQTFKNFIINTAYLYSLSESDMAKVFEQSINDSVQFDDDLCKKAAKKLYTYRNQKIDVPNLIEQDVDESIDDSLKTAKPLDVLSSCHANNEENMEIVERLISTCDLDVSVINVLILYAAKKLNGKLNYNYLQKIVVTWKEKKINTFKKAYDYVMSGQIETIKAPRAKQDNTPDWVKDYIKDLEKGW